MTQTITIPARRGKALYLPAGAWIKIVNTHGSQVVDAWAFNAGALAEHMSMEHTRTHLSKIIPGTGDQLVTNHRRPILTIVEDTSPGIHDTLIAACDQYRYQSLGAVGHHDNCTDNLATALRDLGHHNVATPAPLNLFMNIPVGPGGALQFRPSVSKPGDYVMLRAEMDVIFAVSSCPQDMVPINGEHMTPQDVELILE